MKSKITLLSALRFLRQAVIPICWPPPIGSSSLVVLKHNLWFLLGATILASTLAASIMAIYRNKHDAIRVIKVSAEMSALSSAMAKMLICKMVAPRLMVVLLELETFLNRANSEEQKLIQDCVDKCLLVHIFTVISAAVATIPFIACPLLTAQMLPGDTAYPFVVEKLSWVWTCLFFTVSYSVLQIACKVILDVFFATLIWYAAIRFNILALEIRRAINANDIRFCAQKHQGLMRLTDELKSIVQIFAVEVTFAAMITIICGGFVLTRNPTPYEVGKYVFYEIGASLELFMYTWAAGNLMDASEGIADAAFHCDWIGKSPRMLKDLLIITHRSRKPIVIAVNGILPALSLEFYGSTMAATFSYLTTLRAMTED